MERLLGLYSLGVLGFVLKLFLRSFMGCSHGFVVNLFATFFLVLRWVCLHGFLDVFLSCASLVVSLWLLLDVLLGFRP